jgi:hypothetical protein
MSRQERNRIADALLIIVKRIRNLETIESVLLTRSRSAVNATQPGDTYTRWKLGAIETITVQIRHAP